VEAPGRRFHYNNYNPLLVGLALERVVGMPVAAYLERTLWQPLGMEADGSWSLDSRRSGFEKMESGLNARAIDFAKFGVLYAGGDAWRGRQLVPAAWVGDPTVMPTGGGAMPAAGYQFFWWVQSERRRRSLPGASTASTCMWCPRPGWCWSGSGPTPATRTGHSCSATWQNGWMRP
jgi:CubicO group peptidase (beta-lactamase class C family)